MSKPPLRVMITGPDNVQAPFAEHDERTGRWRIWQSFAPDVRSGTYLDLYATGQVERVTVLNGDVMDITTVFYPPTFSPPYDR